MRIEKVFEQYPNLGDHGFDGSDLNSEFPTMVEKCVHWLADKRPTKTVSPSSPSSYKLKHVVENEMGGYISNGAFIAAAASLNFPIKPTGINARIGILQSDIKWIGSN